MVRAELHQSAAAVSSHMQELMSENNVEVQEEEMIKLAIKIICKFNSQYSADTILLFRGFATTKGLKDGTKVHLALEFKIFIFGNFSMMLKHSPLTVTL